mmetsp:Transcript_71965/g.208476  ORF Transcript_71965/g.208476 Transcript_71965/m.208476 type:complete len:301 (-) Transcript_71965:156-1058(-)
MRAHDRIRVIARLVEPSVASGSAIAAETPRLAQRAAASATPQPASAGIGRAQFVEVNGARLYVLMNGDSGTPVLCMPGALGTAETDFAPQLRGLATRHRVVSFDPRGYGKSRPPARDFPPDFYHRDGDDAHAIMVKLGLTPYNLIGWSDGANAAVILAAKRPESVRSLVIFGANPWLDQADVDLLEATRDVKKSWSESMLSLHLPVYGNDLQPMWHSLCDAAVDILKRGGDICQVEAASLRRPTLVLAGGKDPLVPVHYAEWFSRNIPGSRLHVFPAGKHNIHIKYADEFNSLVLDFFGD